MPSQVSDFVKSPEGVKEYEKLGMPYPDWLWDTMYEQDFLKDSSNSPTLMKKYGEGHKPIEVTQIFRKRLENGKEYLYYSQYEYRVDKALSLKHWWTPRHGTYPIPRGSYQQIKQDYDEKPKRVLKDILSVDTGYSIPFSPETLDKIRDLGTPRDHKVQYYLDVGNGTSRPVDSYESLRNEDFDVLFHFGRTPKPLELKIWKESNGIVEDEEMKQDLRNYRAGGSLMPSKRNATIEDVQKMIKEDKSSAATTTKAKSRSKSKSKTFRSPATAEE
jgi:hypothetical protein